MKGSIIERGGSLQLRVSLGKNPLTGKYDTYTETFKGNNHTKAAVRLRELLTELDKGTFVKPGKEKLADYLDQWLEDYCRPNLSPDTTEIYQFMCNRHIIPELGNLTLTSLKSQHIQHLLSKKLSSGRCDGKGGLGNRTIKYIYATLRKALNMAVKSGELAHNPIEGVICPKLTRKEIKTLTEDDINRLLDILNASEYYPIFFTDMFSGMRRSELLALRWKDLDLFEMTASVNRTIKVIRREVLYRPTKTAGSRRKIALTPANCVILREHKEKMNTQRQLLGLLPLSDDDLVFSHYDGKPYLPDSVTHAWMMLVRRNGLTGIRLHDIRHSHASILIKQGVNIKVIQERLGHANISTTLNIYAHLTEGMQAAAAAGFDSILKPQENKLDKELNALVQN